MHLIITFHSLVSCSFFLLLHVNIKALFGYSPFRGGWRGLGGNRRDFDLLGI